jgi:hypothetical protein
VSVLTLEFTHVTYQGGSERHDFHHSKFQGSYGSFFCFWDWLCGTDVPYRAHQLTQVNKFKTQLHAVYFLLSGCCRLLQVQVLQQEFVVVPFFSTAATENTGLRSSSWRIRFSNRTLPFMFHATAMEAKSLLPRL